MAKTTLVQITDDLDGSKNAETYTFALGNQTYEIDLNKKNADKLSAALAPFIEVATKVGGRKSGSTTKVRGNRKDLAAVRAWARDQGMDVSERGRVSADVLNAYDAAN